MNPIIDYYEEKVKNSLTNQEEILVLENVVKFSKPEHVLEAAKHLSAFKFGPKYVLEASKQIALNEDMTKELLDMFSGTLSVFESINYTDQQHLDDIAECVNQLKSTEAILNSEGYLYTKVIESLTDELNTAERRIVLEGPQLDLTKEQVIETTLALTHAQFNVEFVKAFMGPEEEFTKESVIKLQRLINRYDSAYEQLIVLEADKNGNGEIDDHEVVLKNGGKKVDDTVSKKADTASRNASNKMIKSKNKFMRSTAGFRKAGGRIGALVGNTFGKLERMNNEERLEAVLQGGMRKRLSTLIRTSIVVGGASAFGPAAAAIALFVSAATRAKTDKRLKQEMMVELEAEQKIVKEKIRDAESAGDRKTKYELMRIENQLEHGIQRIKTPIRSRKVNLQRG